MEEVDVAITATTAPKKKRAHNAQDIRLANEIAEARTLLNRIKNDAVLSGKCAARGVPGSRIDEGLVLVESAQSAFNLRQQLMGEQTTEFSAHKANYQAAYEGFFELRECTRIVYPNDPGMRETLGATGKIPSDSEQFQTIVRAALAAAAKSPQKDDLASVGFTSAKHAALSDRVDVLEVQRQTVGTIKERAKQATEDRDSDMTNLRSFIRPLQRILKLIERVG
jgi:hypothetical protein